ncbi:GNAT family N-acetyltransferase [Deinococcus roseus]|uniref:N-acetyltransferase domain-containing protein n=1 Tax=Deinococcus roseus TaxID=392414 RepID=A0ABQ2CW07_9DEIO|nr:hypothetical protein [Deinococcus roseus]GGJ19531.1 hypothetical protein GCM10008938_02050 [Deinococcus roseus]
MSHAQEISNLSNLSNLSPASEALLQACIDNYVQMFPVGLYPALLVHDGPDLAYRISGFPVAPLNSVVRSIFDEETAEERINKMFQEFQERQIPFNWLITPESRPLDLKDRLLAQGMELDGELIPMGRSLENLPELQLPEGFHIEQVCTDRQLEDWAKVGQVSFHLPPQAVEIRLAQFSRVLESDLWPVRLYVGSWEGQPACTSGVRLTPGSAGLYFVGTLPGHTRRGLGTLMTLHPLLEARKLGHRVGVLLSSRAGLKVYERLGFERLGTFQIYTKEQASVPQAAASSD